MEYINPPSVSIQNVTHKAFYSRAIDHEIGYNIYLPPDYEDSGDRYPVAYHLHGWKGNESSELIPMERVYRNRRAITVFPNSSPVIGEFDNLPIERMLIDDLFPYIDSNYRTPGTRESRSISGFSMGAGMAFCYAVRHSGLFSSVSAYAGTYHHYFNKGFETVGAAPEKAVELYREMLDEGRDSEEGNVLCLVKENAGIIRGALEINLHIGTTDILYCDNEILRLHLESLCIPHRYVKYYGVGHELGKIV